MKEIIQVTVEVNPEFTSNSIFIYSNKLGYTVNNADIYLVDEVSKNKIKLQTKNSYNNPEGLKYIEIEYLDLDYFYTEESKLYVTGNITVDNNEEKFFKSDYFPSPTKSKTNFKADIFLKKHKNLPIGNLLYKRIRMGFPRWSSVEVNDMSNTLKLLEPLFSPLYTYFNKNITLNIHQRLGHPIQNFKTIKGSREDIGYMLMSNGFISYPLYEGDSYIYPKYFNIKNYTEKSIELSSIYLERHSLNTNLDFNNFINTTLYIRATVDGDYGYVLIKGLNMDKEYIEERVKVLSKNPLQLINKFYKILDISSSISACLSNYVDCKSFHYILKNTITYPPIVDSTLQFFDPNFKLNLNEVNNTLDVYNGNFLVNNIVEQFNLETDSVVNSVYIDEHLRVYWTDGSNLRSSILYKNLTKDTHFNPSTNNNKVVSISNNNTPIGDYVSVVINTEEWNIEEGMIIQIKNKDTILFYDHKTKTFSTKMEVYYPLITDGYIEFELKVTNDDPYICTVRDRLFKTSYVALSCANFIPGITLQATDKTLIHHNGKLTLSDTNNFKDTLVSVSNYESDNIRIEMSTIDQGIVKYWQVEWNGRKITNIDNTFDEISVVHNSDTNIVLLINKAEILKVSSNNDINLSVKLESDVEIFTQVSSKGLVGVTTKNEYVISIKEQEVLINDTI